MERLTFNLGKYNPSYGLVDKASAKPGLFTDYDGFYAHLLATYRLGQFEDTGLTPEEITVLIKEKGKLSSELAYEKLANQTIPTMNHLVKCSADKIGKLESKCDALKKALELMATYLVRLGRVDEMLCDDIPQSLHLKYQPKNDGDYENEPCIKCVQEYYIQQAQEQEGKK